LDTKGLGFYHRCLDNKVICNFQNKKNAPEVVVDGGSTRIPKIQSMTQEFFTGKVPGKTINTENSASQARFAEHDMDYFRNSMDPGEKFLRDREIGKRNVHEDVLDGGTTCIPK